MKDSVKTLLRLIGIILTAIGAAMVILTFIGKVPALLAKCPLRRRPKEYDDYADVDDE